jgi:hypothetical protein
VLRSLFQLMMRGSVVVLAIVALLASGHHGECADHHHDEDGGGAEPTHLCHCPCHALTVPDAPAACTPHLVAAEIMPELVATRCESAVIEIDPPTDKRA